MPGRLIFPSLMLLALGVYCGSRDLEGPCTREDILKNSPEWQAGLAAYAPKPEIIDRLRSLAMEIRIDVYFGTWCSDSKSHLPALFKVMEMADTPLLRADCYAVPEAKSKRAPFFRGNDIKNLPTFIVFVNGLEKGRIVEKPKKSIEEDLLEIIEK
jgi:thiol-disulfide isomerase/thioredoxin